MKLKLTNSIREAKNVIKEKNHISVEILKKLTENMRFK